MLSKNKDLKKKKIIPVNYIPITFGLMTKSKSQRLECICFLTFDFVLFNWNIILMNKIDNVKLETIRLGKKHS